MSSFEQFNKLHQQPDPLIIGNAWNAQSARAFEKLKFQALATTSAGVAETLGYSDGEQMKFEDYLFVIKHLKASTKLPLSVDLEAGYGRTAEGVVDNIIKLVALGVSGINIEDSIVTEGARKIMDAASFAKKLTEITSNLSSGGIEIFINVRCDAFLLSLPDARTEAITRLRLYEKAGAHGLFLPCITNLDDIIAAVGATNLPLNVMCMPNLPAFDKLKTAGVKRISMGNFLNQSVYAYLESAALRVINEGNFSSLFPT
jgi:2-methylisocitrate lyase-like PEP mutase family enzyme